MTGEEVDVNLDQEKVCMSMCNSEYLFPYISFEKENI
jgi:hypothetical protein